MIGIRVDVNQVVATGHIKRDIAIALCLREMEKECVFISADENCIPYLEPYGFRCVILHSKWDDMESEIEILKSVIADLGIDSLLIDSYMVTENYMRQLVSFTVVTYFDELAKYGYECQQLINGVLEPPAYANVRGKALLGPQYVSLRQEFSNLASKKIRPNIKKILITSGGTDNYHFCTTFLNFFLSRKEWSEVKAIVVVGELSLDANTLKQLYENEERVELHINTNRMVQLMQDADYAVTAGGTTLYEICAVGVSASCYVIGDNQIDIATSFHKKGLINYAGDFRKNPKQTMLQILKHMEQARIESFRRENSIALQSLIDGKGARRIAEALVDAPGL